MNKSIIELSGDAKHTRIYIIHIFNILNSLTSYKNIGAYETGLKALYDDFYFEELIKGNWGRDYLSDQTVRNCFNFHQLWEAYRNSNNYGDSFFVYFDPEWYDLLENYLVPVLQSMHEDLIRNNILEDLTSGNLLKKDPISEVDRDSRPNDQDLLWRISNLYELLKT